MPYPNRYLPYYLFSRPLRRKQLNYLERSGAPHRFTFPAAPVPSGLEEIVVPAVLPLKEGSRELIVDISRALEPYFPDITATWRELLIKEFRFDLRVLGVLERLNIGTGATYFCHGDFKGFFENVSYFATRLSKLGVDTRAVARSLELYHF